MPPAGCVRAAAGYRHRPGRLFVIGQGRIAEIVAAKSSERREIFEEACGIAKYRYRKTEAERRLAAAGDNLERLRDILGELESRVGPLEKESDKAQKFLELRPSARAGSDPVGGRRPPGPEAVRQQVRDYETAQATTSALTGRPRPPSRRLRRSGCRHSS